MQLLIFIVASKTNIIFLSFIEMHPYPRQQVIHRYIKVIYKMHILKLK